MPVGSNPKPKSASDSDRLDGQFIDVTTYQKLLQDYTPRPIRTESQHRKALRQIDRLMRKPRRTRAEEELIDLLAVLIEQYEEKEFPTPKSPPHEMLAFLIESKGVSQSDVAKATNIPRSTISAVLAGRRQISKANVARLSDYFNVSPSLFLAD